MTTQELATKLLKRDGIDLSKVTQLEATLTLTPKAEPSLNIFYEEVDNCRFIDYIYISNKWLSDVKVPINPTLSKSIEDTQKDSISLEHKLFLNRLPTNPDDIPKGDLRTQLKLIDRSLIKLKYPPETFPHLYEWLDTTS